MQTIIPQLSKSLKEKLKSANEIWIAVGLLELNHLFFVESPFSSACNAKIKPDEALWESSSSTVPI